MIASVAAEYVLLRAAEYVNHGLWSEGDKKVLSTTGKSGSVDWTSLTVTRRRRSSPAADAGLAPASCKANTVQTTFVRKLGGADTGASIRHLQRPRRRP